MVKRYKDITGQKFGFLTAIQLVERPDFSGKWWLCKCECGELTVVRLDNLASGKTRSCGSFECRQRVHEELAHQS